MYNFYHQMLIDTHTHLYQPQFDSDRDVMIQRALHAGVQRFYLPAIDSETHEKMIALETANPGHCFAMMGLHPCSVNAQVAQELAIVSQWLHKRNFVAIGEIGLDFYWDRTYVAQQYEAFEQQIRWALQYGYPIVIHTRNAMQETIEVVKKYAGTGLKGIFHCFGDTYEIARQIVDMGFLLGIGGVATYKKSGLADVLPRIGLAHMVLETDAPYLTPVPHRGKRNESAYLTHIATQVAAIMGASPETVAQVTSQNALNLFVHQG